MNQMNEWTMNEWKQKKNTINISFISKWNVSIEVEPQTEKKLKDWNQISNQIFVKDNIFKLVNTGFVEICQSDARCRAFVTKNIKIIIFKQNF